MITSTVLLLVALLKIVSVQSILRTQDELTQNCYNFPSSDFGKDNNIKTLHGSSPALILNVGDMAIDFTLPKPNGEMVNLGDLLQEKPVVLLWGHYTCPAWQGLHADTMFIGSSYEEEQLFVDAVKDKVTVVHLIGPEPHPIWPHANFDSGSIKMNMWSTINQPQNFQERLQLSVPRVEPYLHEDVILLVEYLDGKSGGNPRNNPVWCSYANGARSAILIGQDGIILEAQEWFNRDGLTKAVRLNV